MTKLASRLLSVVGAARGSEDASMCVKTGSARHGRLARWGVSTVAVAGLLLCGCGGPDAPTGSDDAHHVIEAESLNCPTDGSSGTNAQDSSTDPIPGRPRCQPSAAPIVLPNSVLASMEKSPR